ncbi:MAG: hypothetical protein R3Y35_01920 [Clostridia bacterium]
MTKLKNKNFEKYIEIAVVILLGITALLTAWATWVGSLHSGNQSTNYTLSNNLASEGNSEYNAGMQSLMQDMLVWNDIADLQFDFINAINTGDDETAATVAEKLYWKLNENLSEDYAAQIAWEFEETDDYVTVIDEWTNYEEAVNSPFNDEDFVDSYFTYANELLTESADTLEQGKEDNSNGDKFGLVTVIFSIALFLLGIVSTIKSTKNKYILLAIAVVSILIATIFMFTIPMPTGFDLFSFLG